MSTAQDSNEARLQEYIDRLDAIIDQSDSAPLKQFKEKITALQVTEIMSDSQNQKGVAGLTLFKDGKYSGKISYKAARSNNFEEWASFRFHEMLHALQFSKSAALHAVPANDKADIWLSPRAFLFSQIAMEIDAYTKQAWLTSEFYKAIGKEPTEDFTHLTQMFNEVSARGGFDLRKSLAYVGVSLCFNSQMQSFEEGEGHVPFIMNYQRDAYYRYVSALQGALERKGVAFAENMQYADISAQDAIDMTRTLGNGCMETGAGALCEVYVPNDIHESMDQAIENLEQYLGIDASGKLPQLSECLQERGPTAQALVASSCKPQ